MSLKKNIIANFLAQGWSSLMGLAFVPLYIKILGIESFGLIGFFLMLQVWLILLDLGMTPTINREMARYKAGAVNKEFILDLLRTIEYLFFILSLIFLGLIFFGAPFLSKAWLKVRNLPDSVVVQAITLMGIVVIAKLWEELYRSAIRGLQEQQWLSVVQVFLSSLRWGGAAIVLLFFSPTIKAFFLWQGFISFISIVIHAQKVYVSLPCNKRKGRFDFEVINGMRNFAGGMIIITILSLFLTQVDKLLLSGLLSLEDFGRFCLASSITGGLIQVVVPINSAIYPKFTELVTSQNEVGLAKTFHDSCQLMSAIIIPPALVLAVFAEQVLLIWTGDPNLSMTVAPILSLLTIGTLLNSFMNVPYMLQLAYGWTRFAIKVNLIAVFIIFPLTLWIVPIYGVIGAAWIWVLLNLGYVLIAAHFMYRRLMTSEKWFWYKESILRPLIIGGLGAWLISLIVNIPSDRIEGFISILFIGIAINLAVICSIPNIFHRVIASIKKVTL